MSTGERLATFRKSLGKNQIQFAEELGVSQSAYKNYEREATDPPISLVIKLCKEYGLSAEWLLLGRSGMTSAMTDSIIEGAVTVTRSFMIENGFNISPEKEAKVVQYLVRKMCEAGRVNREEQYAIIRLAI